MLSVARIENLENLKYKYLLEKTLVFSIIWSNCKNGEEENVLKKKNQLRY